MYKMAVYRSIANLLMICLQSEAFSNQEIQSKYYFLLQNKIKFYCLSLKAFLFEFKSSMNDLDTLDSRIRNITTISRKEKTFQKFHLANLLSVVLTSQKLMVLFSAVGFDLFLLLLFCFFFTFFLLTCFFGIVLVET